MMNKLSEKQEYVLRTALKTFFKYGYRKTSMDDLAGAAGLTRQGLYFHYRNKDELLKCAVELALDDGMRAVERAMNAEGETLEERLYRAMDAWFGYYVGLFTPELIPDWEFHCNRVMGEEVERANDWFRGQLRQVLLQEPAAPLSGEAAETAVEMLCICGQYWKRTLSLHDDFEARIRSAIRLCCRIQ